MVKAKDLRSFGALLRVTPLQRGASVRSPHLVAGRGGEEKPQILILILMAARSIRFRRSVVMVGSSQAPTPPSPPPAPLPAPAPAVVALGPPAAALAPATAAAAAAAADASGTLALSGVSGWVRLLLFVRARTLACTCARTGTVCTQLRHALARACVCSCAPAFVHARSQAPASSLGMAGWARDLLLFEALGTLTITCASVRGATLHDSPLAPWLGAPPRRERGRRC